MALFTYVCEECEAENEILVRGSETPACPSCGSEKLAKQASAFAPVAAGARQADLPPCASGACAGGACPYSQ